MPKKKKKGKNKKNRTQNLPKRVLVFKEDMQEYAKITKMLGDRRVTVVLPDSSMMLAIIPGRFRRRCWMKVGDIILVSRRDFQDNKLDVIYKYNDDEKRALETGNEIPDFFLDIHATSGENVGIILDFSPEVEDSNNVTVDINDI